jgi:hypothetical protein
MPLGVLSSGGTGWTCRRSGFDLDELYGPASDDVEPWPGGNLMHGLVLTGRFRQVSAVGPGRRRPMGQAGRLHDLRRD